MGLDMMGQFRFSLLDRVAIGISGLCIVHCVLSVVLVAAMSGAGAIFTDPLIHRLGLTGAVVLAAVAIGQGYVVHREVGPALVGTVGVASMAAGLIVPHGWIEVVMTVVGVSIVAVAHVLNVRARKLS